MFAGYLNDPTYNSNWAISIKLKKDMKYINIRLANKFIVVKL